jgi:hypothetical protein
VPFAKRYSPKEASDSIAQNLHTNVVLMKWMPGVDFINNCPREQDEKLFLASGVWQSAHRFGDCRTNFSLLILHDDVANFVKVWGRMLVKSNGQFYAESYLPAIFGLANKVW